MKQLIPIYYLDDITVQIPALKVDDVIVPFELVFRGASGRMFSAGWAGGVATNLTKTPENTDDYISVKLDKHNLGVGEITYQVIFSLDDVNWKNGVRHKGASGSTGIKLVNTTDEVNYDAEQPFVMEFNTAWNLCRFTYADFMASPTYTQIQDLLTLLQGQFDQNEDSFASVLTNVGEMNTSIENFGQKLDTILNEDANTSAIDKWIEVVNFLNGIQDSQTLDGIITTLATKDYVNGEFEKKINKTSISTELEDDDTKVASAGMVKRIAATKQDAEEGKGLSTNDYDNAAKTKLDGLPSEVYSKEEANVEFEKKVNKDGLLVSYDTPYPLPMANNDGLVATTPNPMGGAPLTYDGIGGEWYQREKGLFTGIKNVVRGLKVENVFDEHIIKNKTFISYVVGFGTKDTARVSFFANTWGAGMIRAQIRDPYDQLLVYYNGARYEIPITLRNNNWVALSYDGDGLCTVYFNGKNMKEITSGDGDEFRTNLYYYAMLGGSFANTSAKGVRNVILNTPIDDDWAQKFDNGGNPNKYQIDKGYYLPDVDFDSWHTQKARVEGTQESFIANYDPNDIGFFFWKKNIPSASQKGKYKVTFDLRVLDPRTTTGIKIYCGDSGESILMNYPINDWRHVEFTQHNNNQLGIQCSTTATVEFRNLQFHQLQVTHDYNEEDITTNKWLNKGTTGYVNNIKLVSDDGVKEADVTNEEHYPPYQYGVKAPDSNTDKSATTQLFDDIIAGKSYKPVMTVNGLEWKPITT